MTDVDFLPMIVDDLRDDVERLKSTQAGIPPAHKWKSSYVLIAEKRMRRYWRKVCPG
ncbi:hypothetical protein [Paraburkholderia sp.]|uniref:hypothetical protein n=1 Tax=Paraburkholderia sp. TaxID=1926495 RepID=UPI0025E69ACD|nr:hypothetical protein [Paraburkholderia sp.]